MRFTKSVAIIVCSSISARVTGGVMRPADSVTKKPLSIAELQGEYVIELEEQDQAIEQLEDQSHLGSERSVEKTSASCNKLLDSYYRRTEPRNRMVEVTPTDSVLDSSSVEYFIAVASRYSSNVMHLTRKLRDEPLDEQSVIETMNQLKKEHAKAYLFDQVLLELISISTMEENIQPCQDSENPNPASKPSNPDKTIQPQTEQVEEEDVELTVKIEQEIYTTTTTETFVRAHRDSH